RSFGTLKVLRGVSLEVQPREIVAITGASGAGKSTLLHILGSLDRPDAGELILSGINPFSLNERRLSAFRNQRIGFVFQFHHLLPEFTALENVMIPAIIKGSSRSQAQRQAAELLSSLGLDNRAAHRPGELSGGEQQRVAVCRALVNHPDVVLADEPSGNLDSAGARDLHELFFKLRDELGQTFVIVTHNPALAGLADRVIAMRDGMIA
ncbi:MAG TPA: ABC transporter ATP-binding protein, partial [Bacteroidales bacterium]|nr:ABC transporter ATP-binding protein [Bacteroidales bacterium]